MGALALACGGTTPAPAAPQSTSAIAGPSILITPEMGSPHIGDAAPDFELTDQHGAKVRLADLKGSVVVLAFVTSWCPFSEAEQPNLKKLAEDYAGKNVKIVAIDIKENDEGYKKYVDRVPMPFPVLRDTTGEVTARFTPPKAQPEITDRSSVIVTSNLVLDATGNIQFFTMVDTVHFDAKLVHARRVVDRLLAQGGA